jgi:hypothetical protein
MRTGQVLHSGGYSYGTGTSRGSSLTDYLGKQSGYRDTTVIIISATPKREAKMIESLKSWKVFRCLIRSGPRASSQ